MKKPSIKSNAIGLIYYRSLCDTEELEAHRKALEDIGITLIEIDETGVFKASIDEFTNIEYQKLSSSNTSDIHHLTTLETTILPSAQLNYVSCHGFCSGGQGLRWQQPSNLMEDKIQS